MPLRLVAASAFTLLFLVSSVFMTLAAAAFYLGADTGVLLGIMGATVIGHAAVWAFSPWVTDMIQRYFYSVRQLTFEEFEASHPRVGAFLRDVCVREGLPLPEVRILLDDNPTAYTYGSLPSNARIALSQGLFRFCDDDEVAAIAAHELGHVKHYDFAVMTLANLLLSLLYQTYFVIRRQGGEDRENALVYVAYAAWLLWWVGTWLVLWLSRSRDYLADAFSAEQLHDPRPLQRAVVKVHYGIAELQSQAQAAGRKHDVSLLESTRALGIADVQAASGVGRAVAVAGGRSHDVEPSGYDGYRAQVVSRTTFDPRAIEPVFLFDLYNPWATVSELNSTQPLFGKRLRALNDLAPNYGVDPLFSFEAIDKEGRNLDQEALWGDFAFEVVLWAMPFLMPLLGITLGFFRPELLPGLFLMFLGLGFLIRDLYAFAFLDDFEGTTVYELMADPYASPYRGRPVVLEGEVVGKADAGGKYAADLVLKDGSGGLMTLNYQSGVPILGNVLFGAGAGQKAVGRHVRALGWFRRGVTQRVDLHSLTFDGKTHGSYVRGWALSKGVMLVLGGLLLMAILSSLSSSLDFGEPEPEPGEPRILKING